MYFCSLKITSMSTDVRAKGSWVCLLVFYCKGKLGLGVERNVDTKQNV